MVGLPEAASSLLSSDFFVNEKVEAVEDGAVVLSELSFLFKLKVKVEAGLLSGLLNEKVGVVVEVGLESGLLKVKVGVVDVLFSCLLNEKVGVELLSGLLKVKLGAAGLSSLSLFKLKVKGLSVVLVVFVVLALPKPNENGLLSVVFSVELLNENVGFEEVVVESVDCLNEKFDVDVCGFNVDLLFVK